MAILRIVNGLILLVTLQKRNSSGGNLLTLGRPQKLSTFSIHAHTEVIVQKVCCTCECHTPCTTALEHTAASYGSSMGIPPRV